jgi:hypothetical protein
MFYPDRATFDHVGIVTTTVHPETQFDPGGRTWVTSPRRSKANIEWLRFEPDSPVDGPLRTQPHFAYRVVSLDRALEGHEVIYPPFTEGGGFARSAFVLIEGVVVELRQHRDPEDQGWWF